MQSVAKRGAASQIMKGEKLLGEKFFDQINFPEYKALTKVGAKYASCIPKLPNWRVSTCSAFVRVSALKTRLHESRISSGVDSASSAEANRMSCLMEEWNFLSRSFFLSSFSRLCSS